MVTNLTPPKKRGTAPAKAESGAVFPQERAETKPAAGKHQLLLGTIETGAAAESLEKTMRLAMKAAGTDEAGFRKLPNHEQLAFMAQARGQQRPEAVAAVRGQVERKLVPCAHVFKSPWNRKRFIESGMEKLVDSIREHGVIQDALLRPFVDSDKHTLIDREAAKALRDKGIEPYELIAGERRWRGCERVGIDLPAKIKRDCSDEEAVELQAIENFQREDPNPIEAAEKYHQLLEMYGARGLKREEGIQEIIRRVHGGENNIGRSTIYDYLRLLKLPDEVKDAALDGRLPPSHAREIAKLEHDREIQLEVAKQVLVKPKGREDEEREEGGIMSFRDTKNLVKSREQFIENRAKWRTKKEEFEAAGLRVLSDEENSAAIGGHDNGYWYLSHRGDRGQFVKGDDQVTHIAGSNYRQYSKLWKKAPPAVLGQTPQGVPVIIYEKAAADAAVKAGGKLQKVTGNGVRQKSAAEVKAAETQKRRDVAFLLALEQIGLCEGKAERETDEIWRVLAKLVVPSYLNQEQTKQLCRLNGWEVATYKYERLGEYLAAMKGPRLRAFTLQAALYLRAQPEHWRGKFEWSAHLKDACGVHSISLEQIERDLMSEPDEEEKELPARIITLLHSRPGEQFAVQAICDELKVSKRDVYVCLATRMKNEKRIQKVGPALYTAAGTVAPPKQMALGDFIVQTIEARPGSEFRLGSIYEAVSLSGRSEVTTKTVEACLRDLVSQKRVKKTGVGVYTALDLPARLDVQASGRKEKK